MENLELIVDLHRDSERQGPGSDSVTERAIALAGLHSEERLSIADLGCGTGASTRCLATALNAEVTAIDFLPEFIEILQRSIADSNLNQRIHPMVGSMDELEFAEEELDAIWCEGAIYNIGFEKGIRYWRQFLKPGGVLAVSEITWLTAQRPTEIDTYWISQYPEIDTASAKIKILEENGYSPLGYFALPEECWLENYYRPVQEKFDAFLSRHGNSEAARSIVDSETQEIATYERFKDYFSYGFYIAEKRP